MVVARAGADARSSDPAMPRRCRSRTIATRARSKIVAEAAFRAREEDQLADAPFRLHCHAGAVIAFVPAAGDGKRSARHGRPVPGRCRPRLDEAVDRTLDMTFHRRGARQAVADRCGSGEVVVVAERRETEIAAGKPEVQRIFEKAGPKLRGDIIIVPHDLDLTPVQVGRHQPDLSAETWGSDWISKGPDGISPENIRC
ncbi:hypothetical protein DdX_21051 [Ditylenchus destructor]|uniref:Uncharacterized protein n=1 Tax=Ditylenchus destructor TaxID=166010 RepID=A0AAD4MFE5_9BILA|nr:hypothetical protein DdX_21051 [Ditylenchus destructor]